MDDKRWRMHWEVYGYCRCWKVSASQTLAPIIVEDVEEGRAEGRLACCKVSVLQHQSPRLDEDLLKSCISRAGRYAYDSQCGMTFIHLSAQEGAFETLER